MSVTVLQKINPLTLPSLALAERKYLPACAALYFVIESETVLYIGRSKNLANRWISHHKLDKLLLEESEVRIAWFAVECVESVAALEDFLIQYIKPALNKRICQTDASTAKFTCDGEPKTAKLTFRVPLTIKQKVELAANGDIANWVREAIVEKLEHAVQKVA